jgi:hypothetical protein
MKEFQVIRRREDRASTSIYRRSVSIRLPVSETFIDEPRPR